MPSQTSPYLACVSVTPQCPVEATTYGYRPNLAGNILFAVIFGLCGVLQLALGIRFRTWSWMAGCAIGCLFEMAGYIGRILMHDNPWNANGFKLQIVALILSPSFIAASVDLTMKHVALTFGEERSRIKPRLYTWVFIGVDFFSIVVQAVGGGIAASGLEHPEYLNTGDDVMIAGIALQIFQLVIFGLVALEYSIRLFLNRSTLSASSSAYLRSFKFRFFITCVTLAYFGILVRCVYRMPEMAGGWGSGLQRNETLFLILDGAMVCAAAILLTIGHPGIFFPQLTSGYWKKVEHGQVPAQTTEAAKDGEKKGDEEVGDVSN